LINNRQAGRRRGRNNQRPQGGGNRSSGDSGNRIDSRARGNATQLLEKYRNLARDAQMAGDRVNAEYYFQFADHYFRVLADNRARQEEQQARFRRNDDTDQDGFDMADEGDDGNDDGYDGFPGEPEQQSAPQPRRYDESRDNRPRDRDRTQDRAQPGRRDDSRQDAPRQDGRGPRPRVANDDMDEAERNNAIDLAALPPAIGRADDDSPALPESGDETGTPPKPRRGRRPRQQTEAAE
jgi:hypothetical protein